MLLTSWDRMIEFSNDYSTYMQCERPHGLASSAPQALSRRTDKGLKNTTFSAGSYGPCVFVRVCPYSVNTTLPIFKSVGDDLPLEAYMDSAGILNSRSDAYTGGAGSPYQGASVHVVNGESQSIPADPSSSALQFSRRSRTLSTTHRLYFTPSQSFNLGSSPWELQTEKSKDSIDASCLCHLSLRFCVENK